MSRDNKGKFKSTNTSIQKEYSVYLNRMRARETALNKKKLSNNMSIGERNLIAMRLEDKTQTGWMSMKEFKQLDVREQELFLGRIKRAYENKTNTWNEVKTTANKFTDNFRDRWNIDENEISDEELNILFVNIMKDDDTYEFYDNESRGFFQEELAQLDGRQKMIDWVRNNIRR